VMISEVVMLWTMFFDDEDAPQADPRRDRFQEFAEYLVDTVIMYQDSPTDIGGQLPKQRNVHLLIAQVVTKESSVTPDVVGPQGEVGLMQIMPTNKIALAGYLPETVQHNPRLGLILGIRWLAHMVSECPQNDIFEVGWDDYNWLGPLSVYAGGQKAKRKNGTCMSFDIARDRIAMTLFYRSRIDHAMKSDN